MAKFCRKIPQIEVNGKMVDSKLFSDLFSYTKNRELTKSIWAFTKTGMIDQSQLQFDENGEPTLESLKKALNLKQLFPEGDSVTNVKNNLNAVDNDGNLVTHKNVQETLDKIDQSNDENPKTVAQPIVTSKGVQIVVEPKTTENATIPEEVKFGNELNKRLLGLLRKNGFDAAYMDNPRFAAIFSPGSAEDNANGYKTAILVAKGEIGEEAFPEEFAHLAVAGLQHNTTVQRLLRSLSDIDVIKEVLGDEYQKYVELYEGEYQSLREEAAGKLLGQYIKNQEMAVDRKPLLARLWQFLKDILSNENTTTIDNAIQAAHQAASEIAKGILNDDLLDQIDVDAIETARELYATNTRIVGMRSLLERAMQTAQRRMKLLADRSKEKEYDEKLLNDIKELNKYLRNKNYTLGCISFLNDTLVEAKEILNAIDDNDLKGITNISSQAKLRKAAKLLREMKEFHDGFSPIVATFQNIEIMKESGDVRLTDEEAKQIADLATEVQKILNKIDFMYNGDVENPSKYPGLRYNVVFAFLKNYFGEDKIIKQANGKEGILSLEMILRSASKDINFIDRWVSSMSDASDPLLSLIDKVVKDTQTQRDIKLQDILSRVRNTHDKLIRSGNNTDFMLERNSDGKLTGYIISDINFAKYEAEKEAYKVILNKDKSLDYITRKRLMLEWEDEHQPYWKEDDTIITNPEYRIDRLSSLNADQRAYYDAMMELKEMLDAQLPDRVTHLYNAIQIRNSLVEGIANNITDPKQALKMIKGQLADSFERRVDDTDFGETGNGNVTLDFAGNQVKRLPIYFTNELEDMDRLSTDFTSSMMAYAGMAINYGEMNKIVDALELARDLVYNREVQQSVGGTKLSETMKVLGNTFTKAYSLKGGKTNIVQRIDDYYESVIYGKRKKTGAVFVVGDKEISADKILDSVKNYSGVVGLGLNLFAGISNVVQGKLQMFYEGVGGEYFDLKDLAKSKKDYYTQLPELLGEINSVKKKNKLSLLIEKYDALEEFYNNLKYTDYYKSPLARIMGNTNLFILNNLGEHYLHSRNMLAILNNIKVKDENGNNISMYDAYEVYTDEDGNTSLRLKKGIRTLDGQLISTTGIDNTSEEFFQVKKTYESILANQRNMVGKINQSMNGAFNEDDKGAIHRNALGRLVMQFRQWMPAHYSRRFAAKYYDAALGKQREGYYRTLGRFITETALDIARGKKEFAVCWNELKNDKNNYANFKKAISELLSFALLSILVGCAGSEKDKKTWSTRMLIYQLKRAKLETGASIPWFSAIKNGIQIVKSPAASLNTMDNIVDLLYVHNMFVEIDSGRYKGWSKWEKDLSQAAPIYGQVRRAVDMKHDNYMFQSVNNQ